MKNRQNHKSSKYKILWNNNRFKFIMETTFDYIILELNKVCFAIRSLEVMKLIYFSYFHSVLAYGIIFWGNSVHSKHIFKIQKRTIRIITNAGISDSCWDLFKKLEILPF